MKISEYVILPESFRGIELAKIKTKGIATSELRPIP